MYITILALPMFSAIIAGLGGRYIGEQGAKRVTTGLITLSSLIA
jgi:hypothetical protein